MLCMGFGLGMFDLSLQGDGALMRGLRRAGELLGLLRTLLVPLRLQGGDARLGALVFDPPARSGANGSGQQEGKQTNKQAIKHG